MSPSHILLTLAVVVIWGLNYAIMKFGLNGFPPLLLCSIRFFFAAFPAIFFLPRPKASWGMIASYGLTTFALQFGFMFSAIHVGLPPGIASLVHQTQVIFTVVLSVLFFAERPSKWKITGGIISLSGIAVVSLFTQDGSVLSGFVLMLLAAFSWASGNTISKKIQSSSPLSLVVWGSFLAIPPIVLASLILEGPATIVSALSNIDLVTIGVIIYLVLLSTHVAYSLWGYLLNIYPTTTVVPFSLLLPVLGFLSSALFFKEELHDWKIVASLLVMLGVCISLFEKRLRSLVQKMKPLTQKISMK